METQDSSGHCGPDIARESPLHDFYALIEAKKLSPGGNAHADAVEFVDAVGTSVETILDSQADSFSAGVRALEMALGLFAPEQSRSLCADVDYQTIRRGFVDVARSTANLLDRAKRKSLLPAVTIPGAEAIALDVTSHRRTVISMLYDADLRPSVATLARVPISLSARTLSEFLSSPLTRDRDSYGTNADRSTLKHFALGHPLQPLRDFARFDDNCRALRKLLPELTPSEARVVVQNGAFTATEESSVSPDAMRDARRQYPEVDPKDLKYFLLRDPDNLDDRIAAFVNDKKLLVESGLPLNKHEIRICARRRVGDVVQYATRYLKNIDKLRGEFPDLRLHEAKPFAYQPIEKGRLAVETFLLRVERTRERNPALTRSMASKLSLMYRDQESIKVAASERTK